QGFLAYVDLDENTVVLDTAITVKERVSAFAKRFNATIAVNGEAGTSPGMNAPLGQWTGNYMVNGSFLKSEDGPKRPLIWFEKNGPVHYSKESEVVKRMPGKAYNAIWGRFDLLLNGKSAISPYDRTSRSNYPRTLVGMDKEGKRMIMFVVDGRRPLYSRGMTMEMCAETMIAAGAWNAMACDQGGSSEMWSKELGVVNEPSDGVERAVYTHLGFKPKSGK
ncbi:MAG: phosphodiester glycosidase family protein, partial [Bacteroidota bacterium]